MKKILCLVAACMLVTVLASAEDDPIGPAYGKSKIEGRDYKTEGVMKKKKSSGEYGGHGATHGFCTDLGNGTIFGSSQVSPDVILLNWGFFFTHYTCYYIINGFDWKGGSKNTLKDTSATVVCFDPINDPWFPSSPFLNQTDCTATIKFGDNPKTFNSTITCIDGSGIEWKWKEKGKQQGRFSVPVSPSSELNQFDNIESVVNELSK